MEIYSFERLESTQKYLVEKIKKGEISAPVAVIADEQSAGVGSRGNSWIGCRGNFFASFAVGLELLPKDLPLSSVSIYFAYLMKKTLEDLGEEVWLKWPNDLYLQSEKVGGIITRKIESTLVCGIGINLKKSPKGFGSLDSAIPATLLLKKYLELLESFPSWKQIFSEYQIEFEQCRGFSFHIEKYQKSLLNALLCEDGSLLIEGKRVYSLR